MHKTTWAIYRVPLLLAVVSGGGLVAALLTDGAVDILWTLAVALPALLAGRKIVGAKASRS